MNCLFCNDELYGGISTASGQMYGCGSCTKKIVAPNRLVYHKNNNILAYTFLIILNDEVFKDVLITKKVDEEIYTLDFWYTKPTGEKFITINDTRIITPDNAIYEGTKACLRLKNLLPFI